MSLKWQFRNGNANIGEEVSSVLRYGKVRYKYLFVTRVSNIIMDMMTVFIKAEKFHWFLSLLDYEIKT